jgi:signal transduction histidine kinase
MSIVSRLVLLVLAVLIPAILMSLVGMVYVYKERERAVEASLVEMSRALALVVDREIGRMETALTLLSESPSLARDDLQVFRAYLNAVARRTDSEMILYDAEGRVLLVSGGTDGASSPTKPVISGRRVSSGALVSNAFFSSSGQPSYAVVVPVEREGKLVYQLAIIHPIRKFQSVLTDMRLPENWTGVVLDREGVIVARNRDPELHVGSTANPDVLDQFSASGQSVFRSITRDGVPSVTAFTRTPGSGWAFIVAMPESDLERSTADVLRLLGAVALALTIAALLLAVQVGRSIVRPMRRLTQQAEELGRGEEIVAGGTGLREAEMVSASMGAASQQIRSASQTMEMRVAEAVAASERSQAALLQSQKLEALGRLTGGIAHDFNNLLQTLSTGLHLAGMMTERPEAAKALASCKRAVGRAAKLTRQLMAFGRNQVSEATRVDLGDQLLGMEDLLAGALRRDISLRLDLAEDLWPVHVDPLQLELAVLNLAINARDAIEGTGTVRISARNALVGAGEAGDLAEGEYVALAFEDSGAGMEPEVKRRALEPFFTTKGPGKGSGLGLAQVYGFVRQSGGTVNLSSEQGRGTTVTLFLPRSRGVTNGDSVGADRADEVGPCRASVLVVEDDVLVGDLIIPALAAHGFRPTLAASGDEALEKLAAGGTFDIVFSDIVMPGTINGVELAALVAERYPKLPVVLATGYSEAANIPSGLATISKPYEVGTVVAGLRKALNQAGR